MPTYVYEREDGTRFELVESIKSDALETCPTTGQPVKRVIFPVPFIYQGEAFTRHDFPHSEHTNPGVAKRFSPSQIREAQERKLATRPKKRRPYNPLRGLRRTGFKKKPKQE